MLQFKMAVFPLGFREVIPDQTVPEKWKDFALNIGGTQSTLQGIKLPENAGGYCYKDTTKPYLRNRFICWQVSHDVLELAEYSLDYVLTGRQVRYHFEDAPILSGVMVEETQNQVVVMVPTVCSVHRLVFPHPHRLHRQEQALLHLPDMTLLSIFADASVTMARDPAHFHVLNHISANIPAPHTATSALISDREALFALAYEDGLIQVVRLGSSPDTTEVKALKKSSLVNRLWSGWMSGVLRGGGSESPDCPASMALQVCPKEESVLLLSLCRNNQLCLWIYGRRHPEWECKEVVDAVKQVREERGRLMEGARHHLLRKAPSEKPGEIYVGVFLAFPAHRQFCVFRCLLATGSQQHLQHLVTVVSEENDLMDFVLTPTHLWALWTSSSTQPNLNFISLEEDSAGESTWKRVTLEDPPPRDPILTNPSVDPAQFYMDCIFKGGCFSTQTISKALSIYRRSVGSGVIGDTIFSMDVLKSSVCSAVDSEIHREASDFELSDEDYVDLATKCWGRFYSRCVEYHLNGMKPMGVMIDPASGMFCLVRKRVISILRPLDPLEYLWLSGSLTCQPQEFMSTPIACEDPNVMEDVLQLMSAICLVAQRIPEEMREGFKQSLFQLKPADEIAKEIVQNIILNKDSLLLEEEGRKRLQYSGAFLDKLRMQIQNMSNFTDALNTLMRALTLNLDQHENAVMEDDELDRSQVLIMSHLYSSSLGISLVSKAICHMTHTKLLICQNLLILLQLIVEKNFGSNDIQQQIRLNYVAHTTVLTQAYFVLCYLTDLLSSQVPTSILELSMRQLSIMKSTESSSDSSKMLRFLSRPATVVELFLHSEGGSHVRLMMSQNYRWNAENLSSCHFALMPFITTASQLIWPVNSNFIFPEFLLTACQYLQIQEYVRLLETWCEWNSSSRKFLLGSAFLSMGEPEKAYDWLVKASEGISVDEFLASKLPQGEDMDLSRLTVQYYLKVIQLFHQFGHADCVIDLAKLAIDVGNEDDPDMATLWSICFKNHLQLGHFSEAYDDMLSNTDSVRQKDCLRDFIITMFERNELETLMSFPFSNLIEEVENIFESRARSADLVSNNYYDFLYAFHIKKGNMRKAATVMYEQILRLSTEVLGLPSLEKQAFCYLSCMNVLQLVDEKYWWIVKPVPILENGDGQDELPHMSPKRTFDGEEIPVVPTKRQVEVVDLEDLKKEYELVHARLELVKKISDPALLTGSPLSAEELVPLLITADLYERAVCLSRAFCLGMQPIVEGLASRCVRLARMESVDEKEAWAWLAENDREALLVSNVGPLEQAWHLLRHYVELLEVPRETRLLRAVAGRLLSLGAFLPHWLVESYRKKNAAELLRVYLDFGVLEDAADLAMNYIDAFLGVENKEKFGLSTILHANSSPVWLPYTAINQLLLELKDAPDSIFQELYEELTKKLEQYFTVVAQISEDMLTLRRQAKT